VIARPTAWLLVVAIAVAMAPGFAIAQQVRDGGRPSAASPAPTGTGLLAGAVTNDDGSRPVRLAIVGIALGLAAAVALTRLITSLLFDVNAVDPMTYAGVSVGLLSAAVLASYVPALRAATINPVEALRAE